MVTSRTWSKHDERAVLVEPRENGTTELLHRRRADRAVVAVKQRHARMRRRQQRHVIVNRLLHANHNHAEL